MNQFSTATDAHRTCMEQNGPAGNTRYMTTTTNHINTISSRVASKDHILNSDIIDLRILTARIPTIRRRPCFIMFHPHSIRLWFSIRRGGQCCVFGGASACAAALRAWTRSQQPWTSALLQGVRRRGKIPRKAIWENWEIMRPRFLSRYFCWIYSILVYISVYYII